MEILLFQTKPGYREYLLMKTESDPEARGRIVLHQYRQDGPWQLKQISVSPTDQGLGSAFWQVVLLREGLDASQMWVEPTFSREVSFFQRHGFTHIAHPIFH